MFSCGCDWLGLAELSSNMTRSQLEGVGVLSYSFSKLTNMTGS